MSASTVLPLLNLDSLTDEQAQELMWEIARQKGYSLMFCTLEEVLHDVVLTELHEDTLPVLDITPDAVEALGRTSYTSWCHDGDVQREKFIEWVSECLRGKSAAQFDLMFTAVNEQEQRVDVAIIRDEEDLRSIYKLMAYGFSERNIRAELLHTPKNGLQLLEGATGSLSDGKIELRVEPLEG